MWCGRKGIDCNYCGVFGECQRSACCFPIVEPSMLGASPSYTVKITTEKSIDDIKRETVKEFVEKLAIKALSLSAIENYHVCNLIDEVLAEYENEKC